MGSVASGSEWRPALSVSTAPPLALTAVLSYCSRQPQDTPPQPPRVVRAEAAHPLGASARFSDADRDRRQAQKVE